MFEEYEPYEPTDDEVDLWIDDQYGEGTAESLHTLFSNFKKSAGDSLTKELEYAKNSCTAWETRYNKLDEAHNRLLQEMKNLKEQTEQNKISLEIIKYINKDNFYQVLDALLPVDYKYNENFCGRDSSSICSYKITLLLLRHYKNKDLIIKMLNEAKIKCNYDLNKFNPPITWTETELDAIFKNNNNWSKFYIRPTDYCTSDSKYITSYCSTLYNSFSCYLDNPIFFDNFVQNPLLQQEKYLNKIIEVCKHRTDPRADTEFYLLTVFKSLPEINEKYLLDLFTYIPEDSTYLPVYFSDIPRCIKFPDKEFLLKNFKTIEQSLKTSLSKYGGTETAEGKKLAIFCRVKLSDLEKAVIEYANYNFSDLYKEQPAKMIDCFGLDIVAKYFIHHNYEFSVLNTLDDLDTATKIVTKVMEIKKQNQLI